MKWDTKTRLGLLIVILVLVVVLVVANTHEVQIPYLQNDSQMQRSSGVQAQATSSNDTPNDPRSGDSVDSEFLIGNIVANADASQILITDNFWGKRDIGSESKGVRLYERYENRYKLVRQYDVYVRDWEHATFVNSRYVAFTYYPGRGPGGLVLGFFDIESGTYNRPNDIFSDLPADAEYSSQDVLLPPASASGSVLLTFRTQYTPLAHEPEEFGGLPGNQVVLLDFNSMTEHIVTTLNYDTTLTPLGYSTDGKYIVFEKNSLVITTPDEQSVCDQREIACVKCIVQDGFFVVSVDTLNTFDFADRKVFDAWVSRSAVTFEGYNAEYQRWVNDTACDEGDWTS